MLRWIDITSLYKRRKKRLFKAFAVTTLHSLQINCNVSVLFFFSPITPPPSAVDLICRHIAAIVNRHWVSSACCFLPINKAIDPHCCHQFRQKDMQGWVAAHQWLHICSSMYLTHTRTFTSGVWLIQLLWIPLVQQNIVPHCSSCHCLALFTYNERLNNLFSFYF